MNSAAEVILKWGDGEYLFALKLKQVEELQRVCDAPLGVITERLLTDHYDIRDIVHSIRLGLIGGGLAPVIAQQKIEQYVEGQPIDSLDDPSSPLKTAKAVIQALHFGIDATETEDPKTEAAPSKKKSTSRRSKRSSSTSE